MSVPPIAVIGVGAWGKNHVRILRQLGALRWVWDDDPKVREWLATNYPARLAPLEHILVDPDVQGVVIATPPKTHYLLAIKVLNSGKHILLEKPLTVYVADAQQLTEVAVREERILMVGHLMRYHPGFVKLLEIVRSGGIGNIQYLYSNRLQPGRIRTEENSLWSLAPHDMSMLLAIAGMPDTVSCNGGEYRNKGVADLVMATMQFAEGVKGHVFVSWLHPTKERLLFVIGSEGAVAFREGPGWWEINLNGATIHSGVESEPLRIELEHFLDCISNNKRPLTDDREGQQVVRILSACSESINNLGARCQP